MAESIVEKIFWLAINAYHEARNQPEEGIILVCKVVLNRTKDKRWPDTCHDVIWQPYQFSWTLDRRLWPIKNYKSLLKCAIAAKKAYLQWLVGSRAGGINHYHTDKVFPRWRGSMTRVGQTGDHIFYIG